MDYIYDMDTEFMNFTEFFGARNITPGLIRFTNDLAESPSFIIFILTALMFYYLSKRVGELEQDIRDTKGDLQELRDEWDEPASSSDEQDHSLSSRLTDVEKQLKELRRNLDENYNPTSSEEE